MAVGAVRKLEILKRRQRVAELRLQGWSQSAIADELQIRQATISGDLKTVERSWRESAIRDFDAAREHELQRIGMIERNAWEGWKRSCQPLQSATVDGPAADSQKAKRTVKNQSGQARFLEVVMQCIEKRTKLLGLDAPVKVTPTTADGQPLSKEERRAHIEAIMREHFGAEAVWHDGEERGDSHDAEEDLENPGGADGRGTAEAQSQGGVHPAGSHPTSATS
ncbi:MAG: hypothetical protein IAF94_20660 [Pirellulaceae bacterium]|nr:hypothetical protein [Pirellulaceae bacterium]